MTQTNFFLHSLIFDGYVLVVRRGILRGTSAHDDDNDDDAPARETASEKLTESGKPRVFTSR